MLAPETLKPVRTETRSRKFLRWIGGLSLGIVAGLALLMLWPARPVNLKEFDPENFPRREAGAWRAYYEERYPDLAWQVFQITKSEYGFSWRDSIRLSFHSAWAAAHFRRSNKPRELAEARRHIGAFFSIIASACVKPFDHQEAADRELEWWQMRRKKLPREDWARTIAKQCEVIYGMPAESFLPSVRLRVDAMALRDSKRKTGMTEGDWQAIEKLLLEAANQLWTTLHPPSTEAHGQGKDLNSA